VSWHGEIFQVAQKAPNKSRIPPL